MLALLLAAAATIAAENQRPGTPGWEITSPALHQEIEGHAGVTSVLAIAMVFVLRAWIWRRMGRNAA